MGLYSSNSFQICGRSINFGERNNQPINIIEKFCLIDLFYTLCDQIKNKIQNNKDETNKDSEKLEDTSNLDDEHQRLKRAR